MDNDAMNPLVSEAMKKAEVAWLTVRRRQFPVWCLWRDDELLVISGPGEQPAPGLADASMAIVSARGDHGGRIVSWRAAVRRLVPGTDEWSAVAPALAGKRLNSQPSNELVARWATDCVLSALAPVDDEVVDLTR